MTPLEIATVAGDDTSVVRVGGEVDISNAERVLDAVAALLEQKPTHVLMDWSGVTFVDSSGVRVLLTARRTCGEAGVGFSLTSSEMVDRVLKLVGLEDLGGPSDNGHDTPGAG